MRRIALAILLAGFAAAPVKAAPGDRALDDVRILSADDMEGRGVGTAGGAKARAYVAMRFREIGLDPVEQPFSYTGKGGEAVQGVNLVVRIGGSAPGGKVMVVTAHYDHLGVRGGEIYNGADDNASGVAGLLAAAEALVASPPRHTVYLVALDGEESGSRGARAFLAAPPVGLEDIGLNINLDMLAKNAAGELYAAGGARSAWVKSRLETLAVRAPVTLRLGHDTDDDGPHNNWTNQSDHGAFAARGIVWVYFGVEDHPEYHKPADDFATVPPAFFQRAVATVIAAIRLFDQDMDTPAP